MTLKKMGRGALASIVSLAMGLGLTACGRDYTVGYVYVTTASGTSGLVNGYKVDYQQGYLTQLANSPLPSGGKNPVTIVASPDHLSIYIVHRDDSNVVHFLVGTDGKLYPQKTYNILGSFATDASIDAAGKFLYVTYTYQNTILPDGTQQQLYTPANPGPGGVTIFPIGSDGTLGTPSTFALGRNPVKISATNPNHFVYVVAQDSATGNNLFGFSQDPNTGALTPLPGVTINPGNVVSTGFPSGNTPSGIIADASGSHLYVTDQVLNDVMGYTIGANGIPSLIASATTDSAPAGMIIDASGKYLFVAATGAGAVDGYTFGANGEPVRSTVSSSVQVGTGPTCLGMIGAPSSGDPTHGIYLYTSNSLSSNVSGNQMDASTGRLFQVQRTPFSANALPSCLVTVPIVPGR
ncbi:beta-propeller fold lactonase family protein [Edaphobacter sp. 12200R-103]|jgi:6-phosphogluconolactonase (cycloisomerase 2 family)|uniref:lactonase family protein n=1 Tax=Edaphobacter sp. 12200R-103 TaxID=2703788 RepID=UPI00138C3EE5|nr:beta-propeller fold lactonase family protein [Edaphobacter sp. 12200R-103]QHS51939.1 lactonase family protein [Edaphobacter sp. 12200R-103]